MYECLQEDGLIEAIRTPYRLFEFRIVDVILPLIKDDADDNEYDRLETECNAIAEAEYNQIITELRKAQIIINNAFKYPQGGQHAALV